MPLPQYDKQQRLRAARHEAGHWLSYHRYGFSPGGILIDQTNTGKFGAEVTLFKPEPTSSLYVDFLKNRMRTVVAGFVAEGMPNALGEMPPYAFAKDWKPYAHLKDDYANFKALLDELVIHEPANAGEDAILHYSSLFRHEVEQFLDSGREALDDIQAAVLATANNRIDGSELASLPAVRAFLDSL